MANPYLGLRAFTFEDRASFAGRERIITEVVASLTTAGRECTLLFISGPSGSGKSSLAQAGLLPALEKHYLRRHVNPRSVTFRFTEHPLDMLADALVQLGLSRDVTSDPEAVIGTAQSFTDFVCRNTPAQQVNLVVIDQFEELMTQAKENQRAVVFEILSNLPPFRQIQTRFVVTFRSDYLGELFHYQRLFEIAKQGLELRTMTQAELEASAQRPLEVRAQLDAAYRGKTWDPDLVSALAEQAAASATYLPLFQLTLEEIWRGDELSFVAYRRMGGTLASAIRDRATRVLEFVDYDRAQPSIERSAAHQNAILRLLLDLVEVPIETGNRRDVRRRRTRRALIGESPDNTASDRSRILADLVQARLLSIERYGDADYVDIIHESVIANWPRFQLAIESERQTLRQRARFEQAVREWLDNKRADGYLLTGIRLAEARVLMERKDVATQATEACDLINLSIASETAAAEAEQRQLRWRNRILAAVALAAIAGAFFGFWQKSLAEKNARDASEATERATKQTEIAEKNLSEANRARQEQQNQLEDSSRADNAAAEQRFSVGECRSGLAYLGRALHRDPSNPAAQLSLWSKLKTPDTQRPT